MFRCIKSSGFAQLVSLYGAKEGLWYHNLLTRNTQSAQYYASRMQSSLHAVQSEYETAISNRPQADD